jgi:hypothetical protein
MFTDDVVTPTRLEVLIDVLREYSRREWDRSDLIGVLQPKGLPDLSPNSKQAAQTIGAARELGLVVEENQRLRLNIADRTVPTRRVLLEFIDEQMLSRTDVEPFYAPFYAYLLSLNGDACQSRDGDQWAISFNQDCPLVAKADNPFNKPKYTGLNRWYSYSGHGWFDTQGVFQPNPYERVKRKLADIFGTETKIGGVEFFTRLSDHCPELDGGEIFCRAVAKYDRSRGVVSLGLSHALIDLHFDRVIRLFCASDSRGWTIEAAQPPNDGDTLRSGRVDYVEYSS